MSELTEGFEDRYGSPDFEQGKGANLEKFKERKEKTQMKKYGIKPTDTSIDVADLIARDVVGRVLSEEMPKQELDVKSINNQDDDDEEQDDGKDAVEDAKKEMRVKIMQYLNPRVVKSHELKNYMSRSNIKEGIAARLNEIASAKLDLYKKAIAINAPVDLSEGKKENKEKLKNFMRQTGAHAFIKGVTQGPSMLRMGREVVQNPKITSQKVSGLYRNLPNVKTPEAIRAEHDALHTLPVQEEVEQTNEARRMSAAEKLGRAFDLEQQRSALSRQRGIELLKTPESLRADHDALHSQSATEEESEVDQLDEASRNPNVMRQGRTKVVKARVRGGKVQRRKRLSAVKGYTIRGGKLKRMSAQERLRRKRGQRVGKIKRKAKQARALMRRKRSMRRRASLGLKE